MSEYGYIPESPAQSFRNNKGIFTPNDIYDLTRADKFTNLGQLEYISTNTFTNSYADLSITGDYKTHFLTFTNVVPSSTTNIGARFSNDGGTNYVASNYEYAWQRGGTGSGAFNEVRNTSRDRILINGDVLSGTNEGMNGYAYLFDFLNSAKYSSMSFHTSAMGADYLFSFGGGILPTAEVHDSIRFGTLSFAVLSKGTISLYGVKEY